LVAWRNGRATVLRLLAPFFFLILALVIEKALRADTQNQENYSVNRDPKVTTIGAIPSCNADLYIGKTKSCYDFIYTPVGNPIVEVSAATLKLAQMNSATT
jgi:hypothetical protein